MNPSQFPVIRSRPRSRSPSPVARNRVKSDVSEVEVHVEKQNADDTSPGSVTVRGERSNSSLLTVPGTVSDGSNKEQNNGEGALKPGGVAELEHMASMDIPHPCFSINSADSLPHNHDPGFSNSEDPHNNIFTTCPGRAPNPRQAQPENRQDGGGDTSSGRYGAMRGGSAGTGTYTPDQVDQLRRRVKFFFMDPYSKFKARRHIPWKMFLQLLKIIIVTVQLSQFGAQRAEVVEFFEGTNRVLEHLMLAGWDFGYETMPYPPATGEYALYSRQNLLVHIDHAWSQYYNLSDASLGNFNLYNHTETGEHEPIRLCNKFNNYQSFPNGTYIVGGGVGHNCTDLIPLQANDSDSYNIREFLKQHNLSIPFNRLIELTLQFRFKTFHLNLLGSHYGPTCYSVNTTIKFINHQRSGQILVQLKTDQTERICNGKIMSHAAKEEEENFKSRNVGFDAFIICMCTLSIILCARSLVRGWRLKGKVEKLFKKRYGKTLVFSDRMEFVNLWYFLIIINDVCTIIGSSLKIQLESRTVTITSFNYDLCSLMLGVGGLMAWMGCLRYLGFFKAYNILILTLKTAFPSMLRFMVCALAMYAGFMFCGWVVLSPYHIKFRELSTTSECLFSLVNGDDMFVTFSATVSDNLLVWYFSRVYLYVFISLFIYCVLSLFISVIMDTYETLKGYAEHGFPKSDLKEFIDQCNDPLHSGLYRRQHTEETKTQDWSLIDFLSDCCRKSQRQRARSKLDERSQLLTQTI